MTIYEWHDPAYDATLLSEGELELRLKVPKPSGRVSLLFWNKYRTEQYGIQRKTMIKWAESEQYGYYRIVLTGVESRIRYLQYTFEIEREGDKAWVNAEGLKSELAAKGSFSFSYAGDRDAVHAPEWIYDRVWYQIFPERFYNGDPSNDPQGAEAWGGAPTRDNYMGGDLQGILQKLDYLSDLGINAIYLNPIFAASSNHKYDTVNYLEVDPQFGTKEDLRKLVEACHRRDIKIVLDLVINHCGYYHPFFQDVVQNGEQSRYKDWFYIHEYPIALSDEQYDSVGYYRWMPKLRTSNPQVREYVYEIVSFWQKETGIDGWRIDVADEVEFSFLRELNAKVKELDPNAFIIAEIWTDAKRLLLHGGVNTAMNYELRTLLLDLATDSTLTLDAFHDRLIGFLHRYSMKELHQMFNLLGSHDTERILTRLGEDHNQLALLVAFQFALPGNPVVYYGDEVGMTGENDPGCRGCMPWEEQAAANDLTDLFKKWIQRKKADPVLQQGDVYLENGGDGMYIVKRVQDSKVWSLVVNLSGKSREVGELLRMSGLQGRTVTDPWSGAGVPATDRLESGRCLIVQNYSEGAPI
ncbi:glycoside hydrolase family 13 protein [Gorillibacterium massiliense]|uniref:glycoside hydrolase family 13 protein n=1 Tax=Gorillibacterium massiliense TaxID=1280390 RepID=UPI0004AE15E9|nr:glycoside hydrolase family 13 protein [Gorillibacterium massiliense]